MPATALRSETVIFNGYKFRRYPDSKRAHLRNYFWTSGNYRNRGIGALHVEVWKAAHGAVPEGHHIHHKDGNPLNNDLANLACVSPETHAQAHFESPQRMERARQHIADIRPLASAWHGSDAGKEWHRRNSIAIWKNRKPEARTCEQCQAVYQTKHRGESRFCSLKCKAKSRRESGVDNETRFCAQCGATFVVSRFADTACCSRSCAYRNRGRAG